MIWNDDKITRLMSMGMMHGGRDDDATSSAGGSDSGNNGGDFGGLGEELSVDLGGGQSVSINSQTGDVTGSFGSDIEGGGLGTFGREVGLTAGKAVSDFGQFLSDLSPGQIGTGALGLAGFLAGGLPGAVGGLRAGSSLFGDKDKGLTQTAPGGAPTQAAPTQQAPTQQLAGVPSAGGLAGGGLPDSQFGGGESQPALQLAAAGRQSGIAAAPTQAPVNPFLSQRPQFQGLPQVNLGQFPNALGRV